MSGPHIRLKTDIHRKTWVRGHCHLTVKQISSCSACQRSGRACPGIGISLSRDRDQTVSGSGSQLQSDTRWKCAGSVTSRMVQISLSIRRNYGNAAMLLQAARCVLCYTGRASFIRTAQWSASSPPPAAASSPPCPPSMWTPTAAGSLSVRIRQPAAVFSPRWSRSECRRSPFSHQIRGTTSSCWAPWTTPSCVPTPWGCTSGKSAF